MRVEAKVPVPAARILPSVDRKVVSVLFSFRNRLLFLLFGDVDWKRFWNADVTAAF